MLENRNFMDWLLIFCHLALFHVCCIIYFPVLSFIMKDLFFIYIVFHVYVYVYDWSYRSPYFSPLPKLQAVCVLSSSDKTNGFPIQNNHQAAAVGLCWADSVIPITHLWLIEFDFLFSIISNTTMTYSSQNDFHQNFSLFSVRAQISFEKAWL